MSSTGLDLCVQRFFVLAFQEQIQKLAHQIEFMKTVHMQINNRHLKPKPGGYFTITSTSFQAPYSKSNMSSTQTQTSKTGHEDSHTGSISKGLVFAYYYYFFVFSIK